MNYYNEIKKQVNKKVKDTQSKKIDESQNKHINNTIPIKSKNNIIKQANGNIPIKNQLLDKYSNAKEMMAKEKNNYDGKVDIKDASKIEELNNVNLSEMTKSDIYHLATNIFDTYNSVNTFKNDGNEIKVSHADIKECMKKIYKEDQVKYLKEHLQVFSDLGDVIEKHKLAISLASDDGPESVKKCSINPLQTSVYIIYYMYKW